MGTSSWRPPFVQNFNLFTDFVNDFVAFPSEISTTMSFREALETANEIITVLSSAEDEESLEKVAKINVDVDEERSHQQESVKETLRALSKILAEKEEEEKASEADENSKRVESLLTEKSTTAQHIEKLEADVKVFEKNITEKEDEIKELKVKATEVKNNSEEVLPQTKYNFSLYTNVSHIRWDYESEDGQVKGFVASLNDVKPFCLKKSEKSNYDIANYLWDLMEA